MCAHTRACVCVCVCVTHCLAGFESLFLPSGGSQRKMTLLRVRREERGKDYPDEGEVGGWLGGGLRSHNKLQPRQ